MNIGFRTWEQADPELMRKIQKISRFVLPMSKSRLLLPVAGNVDSRALARYFFIWLRRQYSIWLSPLCCH
jgi:hypothetical protein